MESKEGVQTARLVEVGENNDDVDGGKAKVGEVVRPRPSSKTVPNIIMFRHTPIGLVAFLSTM